MYRKVLSWNKRSCVTLFLFQLGANGYMFAIDLNGYVLLHPNLKPQVGLLVSDWLDVSETLSVKWSFFFL